MARYAVRVVRLMADAVRMLITPLVIIAVGYAVGFRFQNGVPAAIAMILLPEFFVITVCCVSPTIGLSIRDADPVQAFGRVVCLLDALYFARNGVDALDGSNYSVRRFT